jgi:hypothetical protein
MTSLRDRRNVAQLAADTYVQRGVGQRTQLHSPGPRTTYSKHVGASTLVQPGTTGFSKVRKKGRNNKSTKKHMHGHRYQVSLPASYQHASFLHFSRRAPMEYKRLKRQRSQNNTFFSSARPLSPTPSSLTRQTDPNFSRKTNFGDLCLDMLDHRVEENDLEVVENDLDATRLSSWTGLPSPVNPSAGLHRTMSSRELNHIRPLTASMRDRSSSQHFVLTNTNGISKRRPLSASASGRALRSVHTKGPTHWAPRHHHPQILGGLTIKTSKGHRKISKVLRHIPSHRSSTNMTKQKTQGFVSPISTRRGPTHPVKWGLRGE